MPTKEQTHKGKPAWVTERRTFNLGKKHADMLEELVLRAKAKNHRANMTTVVEDAIEKLFGEIDFA